jgi:hypothetical protein
VYNIIAYAFSNTRDVSGFAKCAKNVGEKLGDIARVRGLSLED